MMAMACTVGNTECSVGVIGSVRVWPSAGCNVVPRCACLPLEPHVVARLLRKELSGLDVAVPALIGQLIKPQPFETTG